jgi:hypothetical protein
LKTKLLSLFLAVSMLMSAALPAAAADTQPEGLELIRALGILVGDENGNLNLSGGVTRAQFTKMMTMASSYRDSVGGSGYSVFRDVKSSHWASAYIRIAVDNGWVVGYVDGSFRPEGGIKLEEACSALLKMLGYDSSVLVGSFPEAQLNKAASLGLLDGVGAEQGDSLTRGQCVTLFSNLLTAQTSAGAVYASDLGFTVTNGQVDYASLVSKDTHGPFIADSNGMSLPFDGSEITVYRDGALSSSSSVRENDVYYYHSGLRTVWVYSQQASGTITSLEPSAAAPSSVTLAGKTYEIGTASAAYQLSTQGAWHEGDIVTLLLGMNGEVVGVVSAGDGQSEYQGVVLSSTKTTDTDGSTVRILTRVACTDGSERSFYHSGSTLGTGKLVSVNVSADSATVKSLSGRSISGTVNSSGTKMGTYAFADNVQILDVDDSGSYARIYPSRLVGCRISDSDVKWYSLNDDGEISAMILNDATGDTAKYAYITSAENNSSSESLQISGLYEYFMEGTAQTLSTTNRVFSVSRGGAAFYYNSDGSVKSIKNLDSARLSSISGLTAESGSKDYDIAEDVQVLLISAGDCYATTLSSVDVEDYTLTGWYDSGSHSAGGLIRVITAVEK